MIDIIIPIYNAYNELAQCVESISKYTDLDKNRLILVNDCSTDERVASFLNAMTDEHIIVVHNDSNKGFSNSVNIGMMQSTRNDVVLLNSDTIVTKNWLEKLKNCAYIKSNIATVTPLSNNASLCSVPEFMIENSLPKGKTVDEIAEVVEKKCLKKYPKIPVANGFCMFIKREVINKIGYFDARTFEKGYGEENDFCFRASKNGYIHVMCDDTYIYHSGTQSFISDEKKKLCDEHERILKKRYPILSIKKSIYCKINPNSDVSNNLKKYI